jgi:hypothetical protein
MILGNTAATLAWDIIVVFDIITAFVIPVTSDDVIARDVA